MEFGHFFADKKVRGGGGTFTREGHILEKYDKSKIGCLLLILEYYHK